MIKKIFFLFIVSFLYSGEIKWHKDINTLFDKAEKEKKNVMIVMERKNCKYCIKMHKEVLENDAISKYINKNYIAMAIDIQNDDYPPELEVRGTPTIFIFKLNGESKRVVGFQPAMKFIRSIEVSKN